MITCIQDFDSSLQEIGDVVVCLMTRIQSSYEESVDLVGDQRDVLRVRVDPE